MGWGRLWGWIMNNLTPEELHIVTYWELQPFAREEPTETHHTNDLIAIIDRLSHELSEAREAVQNV